MIDWKVPAAAFGLGFALLISPASAESLGVGADAKVGAGVDTPAADVNARTGADIDAGSNAKKGSGSAGANVDADDVQARGGADADVNIE